MISTSATPEQILAYLGITEPKDLNIEAIAYACGATIICEPLFGCEANIIGLDDKAVITVNRNSISTRRRFSAGHELGHWMKDRGQSAFGCSARQIDSEWSANNPETRANRFAGDLLLPLSMFQPRAKNKPVTNDTVEELAEVFQMSRTATALRLVNYGSYPSMLIYFEGGRRKWFVAKKKDVPSALFPVDKPDSYSATAELLSDDTLDSCTDDVRADRWFNLNNSDRYYVKESCFRTGSDSVVTLLWWENEKQIVDIQEEEESREERRSDERWRR